MDIRNWKPAEANDVWDYFSRLRAQLTLRENHLLMYASYLLYLRNAYDEGHALTLSQLLGKKFTDHKSNLEFAIRDHVDEALWSEISASVDVVSDRVLETVILDTTGEYLDATGRITSRHAGIYTPGTLSELAIRLLNIQAGEKVCDICGGIGNFTLQAFLQQPEASYWSKEINIEAQAIMEIRMDVLAKLGYAKQIHAEMGNAFDSFRQNSSEVLHFDKVFGNYPWMMDMDRRDIESSGFLQELEAKAPGVCKRNASDWVFTFLMLDRMKETGKAIGIMLNGSTWNQVSSCKTARKYFLEHGLIEAVIALPEKVFRDTAIATTLVVFSHENKNVRMIDATRLCTEKMRQNIFTHDNIDAILAAYKEDGEHSCRVSVNDILEKNDTVIHPSRYLGNAAPVKNGKPLGEVLKDVYRGAPLTAKELDGILTDVPSKYQYVMLKQINDGVIDADLPYVSALDKKYEKFVAPDHSLILSKIGTPFKCAVVEASPNRKLVINGNMFILRVDEKKANPYYLKAFFESDYGTALLSGICVGSVIRTFNKKALENLVIPLPSLAKQNEIANEYLSIQDEMQIYKMKLAKASRKKSQLFDEMQEG